MSERTQLDPNGDEWLSDKAVGRWLLFAFIGVPLAYGLGLGVATVVGVGDAVLPMLTSAAAIVTGVVLILRPGRRAPKRPDADAVDDVAVQAEPSGVVRQRAARAAGVCAAVCLVLYRAHGWLGGVAVLGFWAGTPVAGYLAGRSAIRELPTEERGQAREVLTRLFGIRGVRWRWLLRWLAAFIGLLVGVGVLVTVASMFK